MENIAFRKDGKYGPNAKLSAAIGHMGESRRNMPVAILEKLGAQLLANRDAALINGGFEEMEKPYVAKTLFATNKGPNQPADRRLTAAVNHLQETHGPAAESRIRAMSGAALILLGERILSEQVGKTNNNTASDQTAPYVPRTLFGG